MADFVAEVAEEESGRWRRAKLSLPLAHESGGGDYATDSNATWRDLTLTPRMRPRAEAAVRSVLALPVASALSESWSYC